MKDHFHQLEQFIRSSLSNPIDAEIRMILERFQLEELGKGEYFKRETEMCNKVGFILEGSLRHLTVKKNGEESTVRITQSNNFVTDMMSIRMRSKTPLSIKTIEASTLLVAPIQEVDYLLETNLTFNRLIREYTADRMAEVGKLYLIFLTGSAKDRYRFILENNPKLLKKFPLRFIASMIGITPTQLSRIRNEKRKKEQPIF